MPQDKSKELLEAVRAGDTTTLEGLLKDEPALLCFQAPNGSSVILLAAYYGHAELTEVFVRHGAQTDAWTEDGKTSYDLASERGHRQVAAWLNSPQKKLP